MYLQYSKYVRHVFKWIIFYLKSLAGRCIYLLENFAILLPYILPVLLSNFVCHLPPPACLAASHLNA
jgi:hypothetical protein